MAPILYGVIALVAGLLLASLVTAMSARQLRNSILTVVLGVGGVLMIVLAVSGRFGLAILLGSYLVWLWRLAQRAQQNASSASAGRQSTPTQQMDVAEALEILGLKPGASRDEIETAHKALMVKNHPDQGGTDWLASRLNQARDTLLGNIG